MTDTHSSTQGQFTGWHMLMLAIAFFGVIIGVNVLLAVVSATSWTGMVVQDSYVAGQEFETERIAHEAQIASGWTPDFRYTAGEAKLTITDGAGKPVDLGEVTVLINRPVGGHDDQTLVLKRLADGEYVAAVTLKAGPWAAGVSAAKADKGPFTLNERFFVDDTAK